MTNCTLSSFFLYLPVIVCKVKYLLQMIRVVERLHIYELLVIPSENIFITTLVAKVMFSQASVILSLNRGGGGPGSKVKHPPPLARVKGQPPPPSQGQRSTTSACQGQRSTTSSWPGSKVKHLPLGQGQRSTTPPPPPEYGNYSQCACGTHPTGMQSCFMYV